MTFRFVQSAFLLAAVLGAVLYLAVPEAMASTTPRIRVEECWSCHGQTLHQDRISVTTCSICHNNFSSYAACAASGCHVFHTEAWLETVFGPAYHSAAFYRDCLSCHERAVPRPSRWIAHDPPLFNVHVVADPAPPHTPAIEDPRHDGGLAPFPASCYACHVSSLTPEHNNDCALCHAADVDITISTAVANNDVRCNTCHPGLHVRTWGAPDYYAPDTRAGPGGRGDYLRWVGDNPAYPGVHGGYKATTAKCGVCHSVHRARGDGIFLLNTSDATCTGCHRAGVSTVTNALVTWEAGGPHGSGDSAACTSLGCHLNNPHGVGGSQYQIVAQKLLNPATDAMLATALASPALSGITTTALSGTVWPDSTESLIRTGYNCNLCHTSSMLAVVGSWTVDGETRWWAEDRHRNIGDHAPVSKTGHPGVGSTAATSRAGLPIAWAPVTDCESCHDQTDTSTRTGFTFPHSQTPAGTSTTGPSRAWLWMSWAGSSGATRQPVASEEQKAFDGNCLKCHRSTEATAGVGITY